MSGFRESEALRRLLVELPALIPVSTVDRLWIFAPRAKGSKETGLVVLSLRADPPEPAARRQVVTLRYEAEAVRGALRRTDQLHEEGWAPADRLPRLIAGVLARLGEGAEEPIERVVEGRPEAWADLLAELDPARGE